MERGIVIEAAEVVEVAKIEVAEEKLLRLEGIAITKTYSQDLLKGAAYFGHLAIILLHTI